MTRKLMLILIIICLAGLLPATTWAQSKTLNFAWQQATADTSDQTFGGWRLYGRTSAEAPYQLLATIPFVSQMTDYSSSQVITSPAGVMTTWTFVLTAYDQAGNESAYSNSVSWTADFQSPTIPLNLRITVQATP